MDERPVVLHDGIYKPVATTSEAIFMITGMTIGAGVLGVPFVIAQVGIPTGLVYIAAVGVVMLTLNLMLADVVTHTKQSLQLPGLAEKYLGIWGKHIITLTFLGSTLGAILAYLIGEGTALSALFGGSPVTWTLCFWAVGMSLVAGGLRRVKKYERLLSCFVIGSITVISLYLLSITNWSNWGYTSLADIFLPYGVILFALHATPAIAEAEAAMPNQPQRFKRAVIVGTLIPIVLYMLFAAAVVGVKGPNTTEVATLGLTRTFGLPLMVLSNLFAIVAMATAFMGITTALTDSLVWDFKLRRSFALALVALLPLVLFFIGPKSFVEVLEVVGGLFIGVQAILIVAMFIKARTRGDINAGHPIINHLWMSVGIVMFVFSFLTIHTLYKLWIN